jgi:hypothetical protein
MNHFDTIIDERSMVLVVYCYNGTTPHPVLCLLSSLLSNSTNQSHHLLLNAWPYIVVMMHCIQQFVGFNEMNLV